MRKPRLILHIGRHKSGTSSLQNALAANEDHLREMGILYPRTGRKGPAHHLIPNAMRGRQPDREVLSKFQAELKAETRGFDTVIMSSESFQNIILPDIVKQFFADFRLETIGYVREYLEYVVSAYSQFIHANDSVCDFPFYARHFQVDLPHFFRLWKRVSKTCRFVRFDRDSLLDGDVVADFLSRFDLPQLPGERRETNPSISGNLLHFKLLMNMANPTGLEHYNTLSRLATEHAHFRGKFYVSRELQREIRRRPYNTILNDVVGAPEADKDFSVFPPCPDRARWAADFRLISDAPKMNDCVARVRWLAGDGDFGG